MTGQQLCSITYFLVPNKSFDVIFMTKIEFFLPGHPNKKTCSFIMFLFEKGYFGMQVSRARNWTSIFAHFDLVQTRDHSTSLWFQHDTLRSFIL